MKGRADLRRRAQAGVDGARPRIEVISRRIHLVGELTEPQRARLRAIAGKPANVAVVARLRSAEGERLLGPVAVSVAAAGSGRSA